MGTNSPNIGLNIPTPNDPAVANVWPSLWNTNATIIDAAVAGLLPLDVSGAANVVLTFTNGSPSQSDNAIFVFSGTLTGNIDVLLPNGKSKLFMVKNSTTGAFALSMGANSTGSPGTPAGSVVAVPQGTTGMFYSDGTNVFSAFPTTFVSPTFTGSVTGPDLSTWSAGGISNLVYLGLGTGANFGPLSMNFANPGSSEKAGVFATFRNSQTGASNNGAYTAYENAGVFEWFCGIRQASNVFEWLAGPTTLALSLDILGNLTAVGVVSDSIGNLRDIPQNSQGGPYTLLATDNGKHILAGGNVTIPQNVFSTNNNVAMVNNTGGNISIIQGSGVTVKFAGTALTGNRTLALNGLCTILCIAANTFIISGVGLT